MSMSNEIVENVRVYIVVSGTLPLFASLDPAAAHQFNDNVQDAYSSLRLVTVDLIPPVVPVKDPAQTVVPIKDPMKSGENETGLKMDAYIAEAKSVVANWPEWKKGSLGSVAPVMSNNELRKIIKEASEALQHPPDTEPRSLQFQGVRAYSGPRELRGATSHPTQDPDAHLEALRTPIEVLQKEARALYHDTYLAILERGGGYQDAAHAAELARDTYLKTFNVNNI